MMKGNEKDCICANNGKHTKNCDAYRLSQFLLQAAAIALDEPDSPEEKCGCADIRGHGTECTKFKSEEKRCCGEWTGRDSYDCDRNGARTKPFTCNCPCHKPETTHEKEYKYCLTCPGGVHLPEKHKLPYEKDNDCGVDTPSRQNKPENVDFIEEALREFSGKFDELLRFDTRRNYIDVSHEVETFLKEKLTEAKNLGERTILAQRINNNDEAVRQNIQRGRLAMKEEVETLAEKMKPILWSDDVNQHNRNIGGYNKLVEFLLILRKMK